MSGKLYYSNGDSDLLALFIIWECDENATRYELIEGIVFCVLGLSLNFLIIGVNTRESILLELDNSDRISSAHDIFRLVCSSTENKGLLGRSQVTKDQIDELLKCVWDSQLKVKL